MKSASILKVADESTLKLRVSQEGRQTEQEFNFDSCFGAFSSQEEVFEDAKALVQSALDGFNVCIFAYGQTGSGKTYTMQGTEEQPGVVPRALGEVFALKARMEANSRFKVALECYMVQLYVDTLIDCFAASSQPQIQTKPAKLEIREDPSNGIINIHNTTILPISTLRDALGAFERGARSRKVFSTELNDVSSRSHMIFTVVISTVNRETGQRLKSKVSFVDLAGSERYDKQHATAERLKEGTKINRSLTALGNVIQRLSTGEKSDHVPYRDNKLTHLMKDSLGGNSKTLMFVNVSPAEGSLHETKQALYFGSKVKEITNPVAKNVESEELRRLREELEALRRQVGGSTLRTTATTLKGK